MKEKLDLSIDSRQLVSMLIGGIIVLGTVFVLGVVVGKKLASTQKVAQAPDLLTALDQKSGSWTPTAKEPPLTFQDELTRKAPEPAGAAPAVAKPKPEDPLPSAPPSPGEMPARKPEGTSAPLGGKIASSTVPVRTGPAAEAGNLPRRPSEAVPNGPFTLQLGASQNREDADRQVARLREKGYAPYVVTAQVPGKGTWYRVRMGSFASKEAANRYLQDFRRETQLEAFVASTK